MKIKFWSFNNKVIRHISLMTLFYALSFSLIQAQTYFFERYGVEQGLSSSKVYTILQDKNDWIWLGTESGVSRFNGSGFTNFTAADGTAGSGVRSIAEDTIGRIWYGHLNGGLTLFDGKRFSRVKLDTISLSGDVTSIRQIGKYIWLTSSKDGAIRVDFPQAGDSVLTGKQYGGNYGLNVITSTYIDTFGVYYCIVPGAIKTYNKEKDIFEIFKPEKLTDYFSIVTIFMDSRGDFWFGTHYGGLYRLVKKSGEMKVYDVRDGLAGNFVSYITEDYRGNVWVGTWGGGITLFYDEKLRTFNKSNGLETLTVHCMVEDSEKNMIIADHYAGISIYKGDHFTSITDPKIIQDKQVFAVEEDDQGKFWLGTNAGVSVYDPLLPAGNPVKVFNEKTNNLINARFIKMDRNGKIWIGTYQRGLFNYDLKSGKMYFNSFLNGNLEKQAVITALEVDKKNMIWIGNYDRLVVYDQGTDEIRTHTQADGLAGTSIKTLFCDRDNNMWIGSEEKIGLTKYDSKKGQFRIIRITEGLVPQTIAQTADSRIWVGTGSGLLGIVNDSVVATITEKDGLLSNNIKFLEPQGDRFLYIGTNFGLNRLNLSDGSIATFTKRNGFTGIEASPNASITDSKGNLWLGTGNGVTRLNPSLMPPSDARPKVHLGSLKVNYELHEMVNNLKLSYKEKTILFDYYSVSLTEPDAVKYKLMLKGFDSDWKPATNMTQKDYSLSPGHYTFRVMASNSYGYWNEEPLEYSFVIKPPFYQTPWFISLCLIIAAIGVISYIKVRERNLILEKKILEQKVAERTAEVVQKSMEIEEKNRDITASIRYAERIQRAMLPRDDMFRETFVLYMPKDIVSGDFYWMHDNGDLQFIAACDCTGHGVPGAFMSIIGHNSLNKVVREYGITRPGAILDQLNAEVVKALMQRNEETINDGMDMSLIAFDKKRFTLEFAGAYNSVYLVRKGEIFLYKADRFPIGMSSIQAKKSFQNQVIDIQPGDMIYMSSDGYADQFGYNDGKKYKSGNVKKLLCGIWDLPIDDQRDRLEKEILDWKGDLQQVDDIMFIGTRIPER
ncbi:MAG: SpoIIE family protein phosphatase [Bacteroidales bacterium]|jgi:ligand-binding sensor domain-containing protein/serine phosphatase RsbU (regulator of sigma subunit)|nr:SpoIIE family protein phosphatase [Bacteroidales bacterium]